MHTDIFVWRAVLVQLQTELPEETEFYKQSEMSVEGRKLFMFLKKPATKTEGWLRRPEDCDFPHTVFKDSIAHLGFYLGHDF